MNVLSLFDGISCGRVALERAGITVTRYYASEIDKHAIQVSKKNFSDIIRLGDVNGWDKWGNLDIDLIIGGSPCQGFSFAGKQLAFDDPRSALFCKFVEILNHYKPEYFLLENVKMKKEYQTVISGALGVEPIVINSNLVSAQNRIRYYWTNIPVSNLSDKNIQLFNILEKSTKADGEYSPCTVNYTHKNSELIFAGLANNIKGFESRRRVYSPAGKCPTLLAHSGGQSEPKISINAMEYRKLTPIECERLQNLPDNYTQGVSNTQRYKMLGNAWTVDVVAHIFKGLK